MCFIAALIVTFVGILPIVGLGYSTGAAQAEGAFPLWTDNVDSGYHWSRTNWEGRNTVGYNGSVCYATRSGYTYAELISDREFDLAGFQSATFT